MRNAKLVILAMLFVAGGPLVARAIPGDTLRSLPSPGSCPQGLTFDGTYLWNADRRSDQIYKIDPADGTTVDSLLTPGYVPRGLTWDGMRLWCIDDAAEKIYAINPETRLVEKTIYCPVSQAMGLAWDGTALWIAADRNEKISKIDPEDGTTIVSIPSPTSHSCGLTFAGSYLWVSDRYRDEIYMVSPESGDVIVTITAPGPYAWGLAWDGSYLWNVDYETDRIYKLNVASDAFFTRMATKSEHVDLVHQVRNFGPGTIESLEVYIAVPTDLPNQELLGKATFEPEPATITTDKWGQKIAVFRFTDLDATDFTTVTMHVDVHLSQIRYFIFPEKVGSIDDIPRDLRRHYLVDDNKFELDNPIIQNAVREAIGDETNPYWIARKIFNYVIDHLEYELAGGWNVAQAVLERGNGSCSEYSFVYIAMCRAAGVPARYAGSVVIRGDDASYDDVFHRWVEVFLPEYGWIPVDPSRGDSPWPAARANSFGFLGNSVLATTIGGGGSEYLEWSYNSNEKWISSGRCKIEVESFAEWTPLLTQGK